MSNTNVNLIAVALVVVLFASCSRNTDSQRNTSVSTDQGLVDSDQDAVENNRSDNRAVKSRYDLDDATYYSAVEPVDDPGGLRIAGPNSSDEIRSCTSINGLSIAELEALMRPSIADERSSKDGFLGAKERLIEVLASDNDLVNGMGLTHRDLAIPLLQICRHAHQKRKQLKQWKTVELKHANIRWRVDFVEFKGFQYSPFNDQTETNIDYTVTNLENGESVEFSGLVPIMIERYGFYEGHGTPYRVEPTDIANVLGL